MSSSGGEKREDVYHQEQGDVMSTTHSAPLEDEGEGKDDDDVIMDPLILPHWVCGKKILFRFSTLFSLMVVEKIYSTTNEEWRAFHYHVRLWYYHSYSILVFKEQRQLRKAPSQSPTKSSPRISSLYRRYSYCWQKYFLLTWLHH